MADSFQQTAGQKGDQNRYAHLVSPSSVKIKASQQQKQQARYQPTSAASINKPSHDQYQNTNNNNKPGNQHQHSHAPPLGVVAGVGQNQNLHQQQTGSQAAQGGGQWKSGQPPNYNYYSSFSTVDWREQWIIMKEKILERVAEPNYQKRLILFIVCCALLLDNMLYMVIVPIIPDYLRSIGAWSTYTENAKWIRRNSTFGGAPKWERVGGQVVYEGEDSAVGFLFASKAIVQLFINPFSGAIIDRIGYEIPMMIGLIVMFFSTMVFACGQTYSVLFLARSLQGVGSAFADTSGLAMIADRFTEENERQRALGVALAFISFGCLVAPPFGSVLYQGAGKEVPFIILSLVCLLDGSLLLLVTPPGTFNQLLPSYFAQQQPAHNYYNAAYPNLPTSPRDVAPVQPQVSTMTTVSTTSASKATVTTTTATGTGIETGNEAQDIERARTNKQQALKRQKSISRRHSMTLASAGEAPKGTPIYVLFRDPCIACCSGALIVANVSLAFLEPTISIWVQNTMPDIEEWQMGMIWLPAFVPHVLGVYSTVKLADKYPRYQWLIAAIGLILEGLSCLMVPFCTSFWSLIIPISIICFGLALIDTAILPTLGFLVDTRYVSVYGSIYAIADISYSLSYAVGPIIAGGIVEAIGFTALNFLIAIVTLGYTPILMMLRTIHDYEPFEADNSGLKKKRAKEAAPFGKFGRGPIDEAGEEEEDSYVDYQNKNQKQVTSYHDNPPAWASGDQKQPVKPALSKKSSSNYNSATASPRSVKIVESSPEQHNVIRSNNFTSKYDNQDLDDGYDDDYYSNQRQPDYESARSDYGATDQTTNATSGSSSGYYVPDRLTEEEEEDDEDEVDRAANDPNGRGQQQQAEVRNPFLK